MEKLPTATDSVAPRGVDREPRDSPKVGHGVLLEERGRRRLIVLPLGTFQRLVEFGESSRSKLADVLGDPPGIFAGVFLHKRRIRSPNQNDRVSGYKISGSRGD